MRVDGDIEIVPSMIDAETRAVRETVTDTLTHALTFTVALEERVRRGEALSEGNDDEDLDRPPLADIPADFDGLCVDTGDFESDKDDDGEPVFESKLLDDGDKIDVEDCVDDREKSILFVGAVVVDVEAVANGIEIVASALTEALLLRDTIDEIDS